MSRVVLAMSGGVDSSVAAHLLRGAGHEVIGVFMRHGETAETSCASTQSTPAATGIARESAGDASRPPHQENVARHGALPIVSERLGHKRGCCTAGDAADARRVADRLDIPFYAIDFQQDFARIIDYFIDEYAAARTPNPCVMCNNWIKFGRLFDYADSVGAEFVATGHYARLLAGAGPAGQPGLGRGLDESKDQSYVLFGIERRLLGRMMLPVGDYHKTEIRRLARELGMAVADKKDSQEICFVPEGDHAEFIRGKRGASESAGEIVMSDGTVVGTHAGLEKFTIGQRKGLGVALGEPRFVIRLERATHRVVLGTKDELAQTALTAHRANWLVDPPGRPRACQAKIRYNAPPAPANVVALAGDRLAVTFERPQYAVAPGQAVVCFDGPQVLGGGWIE
ncbi:MAG TPA: tRNA 2-thiouridine(34) synthase MnmA [Pirellulales bacterium]|nr:tRNA 2-thiouridine(34) synthase MnmA [Pirellulales bacterium]